MFTQSPLKDYARQLEASGQRHNLASALNNDITDMFLCDLKFRLKNQKNIIITVWGDTGSGKSTVAQFLGKYLTDHIPPENLKRIQKEFGRTPKFTADNICFTRSELLKKVEKSTPHETFLFDEDNDVRYGIGAGREQEQMERLNKVVRAEQNNFIFCNPEQTNRQQHFTLQAFDIDPDHKRNRSIVYDRQRNQLGYTTDILGTIITPYYEIPDYHKKKTKYIRAVKARNSGQRSKEYEQVAEEILEKYGEKLFTDSGNFKSGISKTVIELLIEKEYGEDRYAGTELDKIVSILRLNKIQEAIDE